MVTYYSKQGKSEVEFDIKVGTELFQLFRVSEWADTLQQKKVNHVIDMLYKKIR